jgi:hypothetical protein
MFEVNHWRDVSLPGDPRMGVIVGTIDGNSTLRLGIAVAEG